MRLQSTADHSRHWPNSSICSLPEHVMKTCSFLAPAPDLRRNRRSLSADMLGRSRRSLPIGTVLPKTLGQVGSGRRHFYL